MNALVVYQTKTGTTKKMANEIAAQLAQNNARVKVASIDEVSHDEFLAAEQIYIGCPTEGLFIFGQKPTKDWKKFVNKLPVMANKRAVMFTTYKVATGSMFKKMKSELRYLGLNVDNRAFRSKDGLLNEVQKKVLIETMN
ncbi:MAG TPA: flavodoxin domain-containing protein [Bacteroidales bacterium]|nr:flavodoxin domain-containing protein [Bacteroidales bacterium]